VTVDPNGGLRTICIVTQTAPVETSWVAVFTSEAPDVGPGANPSTVMIALSSRPSQDTLSTSKSLETTSSSVSKFSLASITSSSTSSTTNVGPSKNTGLNAGAKAGVSIGLILGVLLIAAGAYILGMRRRKKGLEETPRKEVEYFGHKPELDGKPMMNTWAKTGIAEDQKQLETLQELHGSERQLDTLRAGDEEGARTRETGRATQETMKDEAGAKTGNFPLSEIG
jgi:hypothetical protein